MVDDSTTGVAVPPVRSTEFRLLPGLAAAKKDVRTLPLGRLRRARQVRSLTGLPDRFFARRAGCMIGA